MSYNAACGDILVAARYPGIHPGTQAADVLLSCELMELICVVMLEEKDRFATYVVRYKYVLLKCRVILQVDESL